MPYKTKEIENKRRKELRAILKKDNPDIYEKKLEKDRVYLREYLKNNPISHKKKKQYRDHWIKTIGIDEFRKKMNNYVKKRRKDCPWEKTYYSILSRLRRSKNIDKWGNRYRCYIGKKITLFHLI